MFGVVLWSDQKQNRAVIWCEDHGDLAFYNGQKDVHFSEAEIEAGDLVQFDLLQGRHLRMAANPRLVCSDEYPTLACDLKNAGKHPGTMSPQAQPSSKKTAKILAFEQRASQDDVIRLPARKAI